MTMKDNMQTLITTDTKIMTTMKMRSNIHQRSQKVKRVALINLTLNQSNLRITKIKDGLEMITKKII